MSQDHTDGPFTAALELHRVRMTWYPRRRMDMPRGEVDLSPDGVVNSVLGSAHRWRRDISETPH